MTRPTITTSLLEAHAYLLAANQTLERSNHREDRDTALGLVEKAINKMDQSLRLARTMRHNLSMPTSELEDDREPDEEPMGDYRWRRGFSGS